MCGNCDMPHQILRPSHIQLRCLQIVPGTFKNTQLSPWPQHCQHQCLAILGLERLQVAGKMRQTRKVDENEIMAASWGKLPSMSFKDRTANVQCQTSVSQKSHKRFFLPWLEYLPVKASV